MTLGFAAAAWDGDTPLVMVASDTRVNANASVLTDAGVKTYELGGPCAAVTAGSALPPMMAAEVCRSIVENHNRRTPERRINFIDTVRLFGYLMKTTAAPRGLSCEVAVVGFLADSTPCLALVRIAPGVRKAAFISCPKGAMKAIPVGISEGKTLLLRSIEAARKDGRPRLSSAVATLLYMARHPGAFDSVGGGIAVGTCEGRAERFSWPLVEIGGQRFLRGLDVTDSYRPSWPTPEVIDYDESWCAKLDRSVATTMDNDFFAQDKIAGSLPAIDLDAIEPGNLFTLHDEPAEWANGSIRPVTTFRWLTLDTAAGSLRPSGSVRSRFQMQSVARPLIEGFPQGFRACPGGL